MRHLEECLGVSTERVGVGHEARNVRVHRIAAERRESAHHATGGAERGARCEDATGRLVVGGDGGERSRADHTGDGSAERVVCGAEYLRQSQLVCRSGRAAYAGRILWVLRDTLERAVEAALTGRLYVEVALPCTLGTHEARIALWHFAGCGQTCCRFWTRSADGGGLRGRCVGRGTGAERSRLGLFGDDAQRLRAQDAASFEESVGYRDALEDIPSGAHRWQDAAKEQKTLADCSGGVVERHAQAGRSKSARGNGGVAEKLLRVAPHLRRLCRLGCRQLDAAKERARCRCRARHDAQLGEVTGAEADIGVRLHRHAVEHGRVGQRLDLFSGRWVKAGDRLAQGDVRLLVYDSAVENVLVLAGVSAVEFFVLPVAAILSVVLRSLVCRRKRRQTLLLAFGDLGFEELRVGHVVLTEGAGVDQVVADSLTSVVIDLDVFDGAVHPAPELPHADVRFSRALGLCHLGLHYAVRRFLDPVYKDLASAGRIEGCVT